MNKISISAEDRKRIIASAEKHGGIDALMIRNWIRDLNYIVDSISAGNFALPYLEGAFWIRIFGLLTEIDKNYEYVAKKIFPLLDKIFEKDMKVVVSLSKDLYSEIQKIKKELSEDDHLIIDYLRQTNCHVFQKGFRIGVKTKKEKKVIKERYLVSTNEKLFLISEIETRLNIIFRSYQANQVLMARDICLKVKKRVNTIHLLCERISKL